MRTRRVVTALTFAAVAGSLLVLAGGVEVRVAWRDNTARAIDLFGSKDEGVFWHEGSDAPPIAPVGLPGSFADLAERVSPGVVNIQTSKTVKGAAVPKAFEDFFFGGPFEERFGQEHKVPSLGSGFVVSPDGYIVTNNHVVENVDTIRVKLLEGPELEAEVVGRDPKTDIALIRVKPDVDLTALPLGDSKTVRPGDWVVAIGNPFGLEHTVTAGIISAKHREIGQGSYDDYIQTDASINPGNSGGPLLNLKGEVIGINTAINPRALRIGFAVPVNMAKDILPQLRAQGHVTRGWLGVVIQRITPELAEHLDLGDQHGALVTRVIPGGPAEEAGVERGDVIVEFDGKKIEEFNDLPRVVASTPISKDVKLEVRREGKTKTLRATVVAMEEGEEEVVASAETGDETEFGLRVQDLTPELAQELGVDEKRGAVVSAVEPGSPADEAGLNRGDVILEVDRNEIDGAGALRDQLAAAGEGALLLVRRGDATIFVPIKRGEG